jgi:adenylate cyclase
MMASDNDQKSHNHESYVERVWRIYLTTGDYETERRQRHLFRLLPGTPRCKMCYAPFHGLGAGLVRLFYGKRPSHLNPRLCNICEEFAKEYQGGAEIELSLLFVDVRGSTSLAENMSPIEYSHLINRFYTTATQVLVDTDALIDKIIGDQVAGMYVPGFAGKEHARRALQGAQEIMKATGHASKGDPWIPLGAGVHTGVAFVGSVGSGEGSSDITVLGDAANTAARLASQAGVGEILISDTAFASAGFAAADLEQRQLNLKGKSERVSVFAITNYEFSQPQHFTEGD